MPDSRDFSSDPRAGAFFIIGGRRIHESDLTARQRATVGLPPLPSPPPAPDATSTVTANE